MSFQKRCFHPSMMGQDEQNWSYLIKHLITLIRRGQKINHKRSSINMLLPLLSDTVKYNSDVSGHEPFIEFLLNQDRRVIILFLYYILLINMCLKCTSETERIINHLFLEGYLWSKLYQILKSQALSCLVLLLSEPSAILIWGKEEKMYFISLQHHLTHHHDITLISYLRSYLDQSPLPPWKNP